MNKDFADSSFARANNKRLKLWLSIEHDQQNDDGETTSGSPGKDTAHRHHNITSPKLQHRLQLIRNSGDTIASKSITPEARGKKTHGDRYVGHLGNDTSVSVTGIGTPKGTTSEKVSHAGCTESFTLNDHNGKPSDIGCDERNTHKNSLVANTEDACHTPMASSRHLGAQDDTSGQQYPTSFQHHESTNDLDTDSDGQLDGDELWVKKKLSVMSSSSIDNFFSNVVPSFSDDESTVSHLCNSKLASMSNVHVDSMYTLMQQQKEYNDNVNKGVKTMKYAAKIPFPNLFLPDEYHHGFFEYMETHGAYQLCRKEKWTSVVNLMISYLLRMTLRSWAGHET